MNDPRTQRPAKVIMLGDSSVGKTSIVLQFYKAQFEMTSEPTIGASYVTKIMKTKRGDLPLHIWDTAGQERFKSVIPMYMRGCSAVVLVCSVDSADSIQNLNTWLRIIEENVSDVENLFLVLNKTDKDPDFDSRCAEEWAKEHHCKFYKTCAKQKETIDPLFQDIAESISDSMTKVCDTQELDVKQEEARRGCCA